MEHLTRSQIVLLTLFVSFVSSMATGIVVVTLMQQTPEPIMQTINRVVERTIERVVPTVVEKPGKHIVAKDEDFIVAAIDRNMKSVISLKVLGEGGEMRAVGVGTVISGDGLVVTDKKNFGSEVLLTTLGSVRYRVEAVPRGNAKSLALGRLVPVAPLATSSPAIVFIPAKFATAAVKVGQTAIIIGGRDGKTIARGFVTNLEVRTAVAKDGQAETKILENIALSERFSGASNGAPIISLEGLIVGFVSVDEATESQVGVPVAEAEKLLSSVLVGENKKEVLNTGERATVILLQE